MKSIRNAIECHVYIETTQQTDYEVNAKVYDAICNQIKVQINWEIGSVIHDDIRSDLGD